MIIKRGIPVSKGVVVGPAIVLGNEDFRIPQRCIEPEKVESEKDRLHIALEAVCVEITENQQLANEQIGAQYGAIFGAHLQMAQDPKMVSEIETQINQNYFSAEFASSKVLGKFAQQFQDLGNAYFAERATDIFDLEKRILRHLLGQRREDLDHLTAPVLVLARNLTPSETARLNRQFVLGFATEVGGHTSHTAILAGALEIPAVVGLGTFLSKISGGELIVIDGDQGLLIIDPDDDTLMKYKESQEKNRLSEKKRESIQNLPPETTDGTRIKIFGNVEFPEEAKVCQKRKADGIGLYRTEFLYLGKEKVPTEEDHYNAYCEVIKAMPNQPVLIRTLDIGADKIPETHDQLYPTDGNPALGLRSIRLSLYDIPLFQTQLRAILRAAVGADVGIMFPLVSSLMEFRQARMIVRETMEDLDEQQIPFNSNVKIGMMVEVPSAAMMADQFAKEVDFFSIGTNDLIQYTLAADRSDPAVAKLFSSGDPAILRMLKSILQAAEENNIPVSVCGQMGSEPKYIPLLLGLGFKQLSVSPQAILEVKQIIRSLSMSDAKEIAQKALSLDTARNVESFLRGELYKICADLVR